MMEQKIYYKNLEYVEVEIGAAPLRAQCLSNDIQDQRKQLGLKHRATSTIHTATSDTLTSMEIEILMSNSNFNIWDKGQIIVILSCTKLEKIPYLLATKMIFSTH